MHFDVTTLDDVKADTTKLEQFIAKRISRWPWDTRVIQAREEIIKLASRGMTRATTFSRENDAFF